MNLGEFFQSFLLSSSLFDAEEAVGQSGDESSGCQLSLVLPASRQTIGGKKWPVRLHSFAYETRVGCANQFCVCFRDKR